MFTDRGNEFLPYILGETNTPMPLFVKPNRKVSGGEKLGKRHRFIPETRSRQKH